MNNRLLNVRTKDYGVASAVMMSVLLFCSISSAQTAPPPNLGENTKGKPAMIDSAEVNEEAKKNLSENSQTSKKSAENEVGPLGKATIKESRRESGHVYRIELEHSAGAKQVIEENGSDGSIENTNKGIDDTPNLPKWTLGSW